MSEVINFRVDKKIKSEAQTIAKKMGLNLSDVLNVLLRGFVRGKELNVNLEEPSDRLSKGLAKADMEWRGNFIEGREIILATSSKGGVPNANIVVSLGFTEGKLLVADCQMDTTIKNIKENPDVCAVGGHCRIKGRAEIFTSGKYLDMCAAKSKGYAVKNAVLIGIGEVFDLDKSAGVDLSAN